MVNVITNKRLIGFFGIAVIIIAITNLLTETIEQKEHNITTLGFKDMLFVFATNSSYIALLLILSITGFNLLMIFKVFITIGQGPSLSGIEPLIYYLSSLTHGIGELLVCFLLFSFTINQAKVLFGYFNGTRGKQDVKTLYMDLIKRIIPAALVIILISSFCEIYISNRLIQLLI